MTETSIKSYYSQDHDRLGKLFERFRSLKASFPQQAHELFREFSRGLQRHIAWEEEILFPVFEEKTGMRGMGPTEIMRMEHQRIKQLLAAIERRLQEGTAGVEESALIEVLEAHNDKEEHILYPAIDSQMSDAERQDVFARMEEVTHG